MTETKSQPFDNLSDEHALALEKAYQSAFNMSMVMIPPASPDRWHRAWREALIATLKKAEALGIIAVPVETADTVPLETDENELFLCPDGQLMRRSDLPNETVFVVSRSDDDMTGIVTIGLSNGESVELTRVQVIAAPWNPIPHQCLVAGAAVPFIYVLNPDHQGVQ